MISLLTLAVGVIAIMIFGRVVAEMFGWQSRPPVDAGERDFHELREGTQPERSVTEDLNTRSDAQAAPPARLPVSRTVEQRLADLKRQYVADEITVEQYEAELDKLMRRE